ncbi:Nuclear Hormone Receptor family [Caenorhabditis elegans]|uniref:Nuclear Hormone Receptor family n=1 Tax=Caenorhabditis elegans TaxID=6239 RepID=O45315_CAEEL|nr:Nuclear Hormone Receptor family [Caenorhabditis elegans]CAB03998.2 Nuclear Hormone Receptor family [Caenorhabditis elegans]|eukprot:NP_507673.2 Nuclear Hormone Receptor family [Caenorhabditis elegans]
MEFPSSSSEMTYFTVNCEICQKTSHGLHFGLETCRACAAFFRRTVVLNRKYKCIQKTGKCEIGAGGEEKLCKFCRFKKCIDLGMTTENVRTDFKDDSEDTSSQSPQSTSSMEVTSSQQIVAKVRNRVEYYIVNPKTQAPAMLIDVNAIIKESRAILETHYFPDEDLIAHLNPLQRMSHSLHKIREKQSWSPEFFEHVKFYKMFQWWEVQMRDTATWLMHSDEFRRLPSHEKIAIFKIVWAVWRRFERYTMSAQMFGQKCYDEKIHVHNHQFAARFGNYHIDYSNVSDHGFERFNNVFGGKMIRYFDIIVKPYLELNLSETEVTYILCQIVWNYAGRRLQGQTQAAGERFLEEISNNLHSYYEEAARKEENPKNYASRLTKMMQIVNEMLSIQLKRENTMDIAMLFDMFNIVFTEPEFFRV